MKITNHEKIKYERNCREQIMRNIFGDQGNMERNFWEQGNSIKVNFGEHLHLFLSHKGTTINFHGEQGNMNPPPPPWEALNFGVSLPRHRLGTTAL